MMDEGDRFAVSIIEVVVSPGPAVAMSGTPQRSPNSEVGLTPPRDACVRLERPFLSSPTRQRAQ